MPENDTEFIPTRKSLLGRLKCWEDDVSWKMFFDTYWKLIYSVALKSGLREAEAQDVVQDTVISVARNIAQYKYNPAVCSFKTWLMQVTRSRISNQFRRRKRHPEAPPEASDLSNDTPMLRRIPAPAEAPLEALWDEEWRKNLMDAALARVKSRVDIRQYQIFDYYVLRQWPVAKVAHTLNVSVARVYLAKHRISKLVREQIVALEDRII